MWAASAGRATGGVSTGRAARYSRTRTAWPSAAVSPVLARRVIVPSRAQVGSARRGTRDRTPFSGLSSAAAIRAARAAASEAVSAGRLRRGSPRAASTPARPRPVARLRAASSSASAHGHALGSRGLVDAGDADDRLAFGVVRVRDADPAGQLAAGSLQGPAGRGQQPPVLRAAVPVEARAHRHARFPSPARSFGVRVLVEILLDGCHERAAGLGGDVPGGAEAEQFGGEILVARISGVGVDELLAVPEDKQGR